MTDKALEASSKTDGVGICTILLRHVLCHAIIGLPKLWQPMIPS